MTYSPATEPLLVDDFCRGIMRFIATRLNANFAIAHELHKNGLNVADAGAEPIIRVIQAGDFKEYIVKSKRDHDAFDGSILEFPRLKVYRVSGSTPLRNTSKRSRLRLSYLQKLTEIHRLPGLWEWLEDMIPELLNIYQFEHTGCSCNIEQDGDISFSHSPRFEVVGGRQELVYRSDFDFSGICIRKAAVF